LHGATVDPSNVHLSNPDAKPAGRCAAAHLLTRDEARRIATKHSGEAAGPAARAINGATLPPTLAASLTTPLHYRVEFLRFAFTGAFATMPQFLRFPFICIRC
jgi:hypothetical protein